MTEQSETQAIDFYEEFIEVSNNCTLCGSPLHFEYEAGAPDNQIVEKCECPSCGLKGTKKAHPVN